MTNYSDSITLQQDLRQCLASNIKGFKQEYGSMLFDGESKIYLQGFKSFDYLNIYTNGTGLVYEGKIKDNLPLPKETIEKIKKEVAIKNVQETFRQAAESMKSEYEKQEETMQQLDLVREMVEENLSQKRYYRKPSKEEIAFMKGMQARLQAIQIPLQYSEEEEGLYLTGNFIALNFDENQLKDIVYLFEQFDHISIAPLFNWEDDNDNKVYGIRIALELSLEEKVIEMEV